jgi:hypothetical protein
MVTVHAPYSATDGQEKLFNTFADSDFDYLLVVDADVVPPLDAASRLLAHDKQIVIAPIWFYDDAAGTISYGAYPRWAQTEEEEPTLKIRVPRTEGLQRIVSGGFGCMLVRKDAIKSFRDKGMSFVKWDESLPEHLKTRTSDNIFWAKCTILGIEAYIDWSIETTHFKTVGLSNNLVNNLRQAKEEV